MITRTKFLNFDKSFRVLLISLSSNILILLILLDKPYRVDLLLLNFPLKNITFMVI